MIVISNYNSLVGKQIGFLFVKGRAPDYIGPSGRRRIQYICDCACGNSNIIRTAESLRDKRIDIHSCGCITRELLSESNTKHGGSHKGNWQRLYRIWSLMKDRCLNNRSKAYKDYGGRGITVCDEWMSYEQFREWAYLNGYKDDLTIDRIDNNGNYCPDNCRWIKKSEQSKNRRFCRYITIGNETHHMSEWARRYHILPSTISARIFAGWSAEQAVTTPVVKRKNNAVITF